MPRTESYLHIARRRADLQSAPARTHVRVPGGATGGWGAAALSPAAGRADVPSILQHARTTALRPYGTGRTGRAGGAGGGAARALDPAPARPPKIADPDTDVPTETPVLAAAASGLRLPELDAALPWDDAGGDAGLPDADSPTMQEELERVRRRQRSPLGQLHRRWQDRRHRRAWVLGLVGVPLVLLTILAITVGPVLLEGTRAYQKVFVDAAPRDSSPLLPVVNSDGTPTVDATAGGGVGGDNGAGGDAGQGGELTVAGGDPAWDGTEPLVMLLIGVDQQTEEESRSDTMILVWVDPVARRAAMLPLPRDLKVIIPGFGIHKINAAYAIGEARGVEGGGPTLTMQTIEANFGIRINHFAQVNFEGFVSVVDLLGGVTLDVPYPIKDNLYPAPNLQYTRVYFPAGWQHMDGERALQYARTRHADNDAQRSIRQQQVLLALREQSSIGELIPRAAELLIALGDSVRTDLDPEQAIRLARLAAEIPLESIEQYTLLNTVSEEDPFGVYYLVPDWNAVGEVLTEFTGTPIYPPAAARDFVNYDIPIRVENGTLNAGLAARVAGVLETNGFTQVTFDSNANAGMVPYSTVVDTSGNLVTTTMVAATIGLDPAIIDERYAGPTAAGTASAGSTPPTTLSDGSDVSVGSGGTSGAAGTGGTWIEPTPEVAIPRAQRRTDPTGEIVIVLGDDAFDPAWYVDTTGGG